METMKPREGWLVYYGQLITGSVLTSLAFVGFMMAWANVDWRYLVLCLPCYLMFKYSK